jgi:hypothetical protein
MPANQRLEGKHNSSNETSGSSDDMRPVITSLATTLTEELAALLAAVLDGRKKKTLDRLSQALSEAMPTLLSRTIENELLADTTTAHERRVRFSAALARLEIPVVARKANTAHEQSKHGIDDTDWMSMDAAAQFLNLSSEALMKLVRNGKLGDVDTDAHGVIRLERTAVLARYQQMHRG